MGRYTPKNWVDLCFDLETVPGEVENEDLYRGLQEAAGESWEPNSLGLSPITGRIVCLGVRTAVMKIAVVKASEDEVELIDWFKGQVNNQQAQYNPDIPIRFVGYNSRGFDARFLAIRALILGVEIPPIPLHRFHEGHLDLFEVLFDYKIQVKGTGRLPVVIPALGLGDVEGIGSEVAADFAAGNLERIADHCQSDIDQTWALFQKLKDSGLIDLALDKGW